MAKSLIYAALATLLIAGLSWAGSSYRSTPGGVAGITQSAADARYPQKNGVGVFARISSVAEDGTHYQDLSNVAPYIGRRTNVEFWTISSQYYCNAAGTCRRIDR